MVQDGLPKKKSGSNFVAAINNSILRIHCGEIWRAIQRQMEPFCGTAAKLHTTIAHPRCFHYDVWYDSVVFLPQVCGVCGRTIECKIRLKNKGVAAYRLCTGNREGATWPIWWSDIKIGSISQHFDLDKEHAVSIFGFGVVHNVYILHALEKITENVIFMM